MRCNEDCFNCPFADCISDKLIDSERAAQDIFDKDVIKGRLTGRKLVTYRYEQSDKGKERQKRYRNSEKGKENEKRKRAKKISSGKNAEYCRRYYERKKARNG